VRVNGCACALNIPQPHAHSHPTMPRLQLYTNEAERPRIIGPDPVMLVPRLLLRHHSTTIFFNCHLSTHTTMSSFLC
jgi:hypothetical protein